jgi:YesN/AraC family two-component response regulator
MELAVLFARTGRNSTSNAAMETNVRCLKQIQEAKTIEELTGVLHYMVDFITGQIVSFQGIPHVLALQKAEIYIRENFTRKIKLREVAKIAGLSAPYFSTIFKEEMGENLSRYINRLRVEKSIKMLLETEFTLNEISNACCFQDQSWYTKIFKSFTGISPGKYRSQGGLLFTQRKGANDSV